MPRTPVHRRYCGTLLFPTLAKQEAWAETMKEALLVASVILLLLFNAFVIFQSIQFYRHRHEPFTTALAALESDDTMAVRCWREGTSFSYRIHHAHALSASFICRVRMCTITRTLLSVERLRA